MSGLVACSAQEPGETPIDLTDEETLHLDASSAVAANQHYSCCLSYLYPWYLPLVVILLSLCEESPARPSDSSLTEDFWMWKLYWNMWSSTLTKVCKIMSRKLEAQLKHAFPSLGLGRIWEKSGKAFCWGAISTDALLALRALSKLYPDMWPACELHETSWDWIIWDWIRLNHTEGKKTVVDGCSLFKILTPFDSATFRDWSHGMLPQLCLSNLEEMNGFSIGV